MEFCWFLRSETLVGGFSVNFLGAMFACGYSRVRVATFYEKLAHFLAFVVKVGVVAKGASKKFREWNDIIYMLSVSGPM